MAEADQPVRAFLRMQDVRTLTSPVERCCAHCMGGKGEPASATALRVITAALRITTTVVVAAILRTAEATATSAPFEVERVALAATIAILDTNHGAAPAITGIANQFDAAAPVYATK